MRRSQYGRNPAAATEDSRMNRCVHSEPTWWEHDARGIPLGKVCDKCVDEVLSRYRPDVLTDPNYWSSEPIEPID